MATAENQILGTAIDIRRGFKRFVDVPVADRPAVAAELRKLSDAKLQEMLGTRARGGGHGETEYSRSR